MGKNTRGYRIRDYPNGVQRRLRDRWFGAYRWPWNTALEIRSEAYRSCDRDVDAARNLLMEGLRQRAGRDDRELRVDAGGACADEEFLVQGLADEARSGHCNSTRLELATLH